MNVRTREEFLAARLAGIGGSDVSALLGLNEYKTPYALWLDKTGRASPTPDNEAMRMGRDFEGYVAFRYAERTGYKVQRFNAQLIDKECPYFIGNVDRLVSVDGKAPAHKGQIRTHLILECKTTLFFDPDMWGPDMSDQVPEHYFMQCQWYMMLANAKQCDLFVLCLGRRELRLYSILRDDEIIAAAREAAERFWVDHVLADMPPPPIKLSDAQARWGRSSVAEAEVPEEWQERIAAYQEAGQVIAEMKAAQDQFKFDLLQQIHEADTVTINGKPVLTYKTNAKGARTLRIKGASSNE